MNIPFLDLKTPHQELEVELITVFQNCLQSASFVGGSMVQSFEEEFARFCEAKYCIAVNSGTDALRFALLAAGIGPGDEVITVPNTFIATTEAISQTGATPVFVDIDERTYNIDPNQLEGFLKSRYALCSMRSANRRKAIIPVHLYGQPADMDAVMEIAGRYGLNVIEDACQAHGARYYSRKEERWKRAGSMGLAGAFSFYPGKNLGACGEGGAVTTSDPEIARKISMLRDHGQAQKYHHEFEGYNGRLDAVQAGILSVKMKYLDGWNEKRRLNALLYTQLLNTASLANPTNSTNSSNSNNPSNPSPSLNTQHLTLNTILTPFVPPWSQPVFHLYVIRVPNRDGLQKYLSDHGIGTGLHYPIPLHLQKAYSGNGFEEGMFPVSEKVASEILSLPMYPGLTRNQIEFVAETIKTFYNHPRNYYSERPK